MPLWMSTFIMYPRRSRASQSAEAGWSDCSGSSAKVTKQMLLVLPEARFRALRFIT